MVVLYLLALCALYICFRTKWVFLLILPYAILNTPSSSSVNARSCAMIDSALQKNFSLCWLMSTIGLLENVTTVHEIDFLHPHVQNLVSEWYDLPFDAKSASCPLVQPPELRKHLLDSLEPLYDVEVTIFKSMFSRDKGCLDTSKVGFFTYAKSLLLGEPTSTSNVEIDEDSRLSFLPSYNAQHYLENDIILNAKWTDPIVEDFLSGKKWWFQYPVCVTKFAGGSASILLIRLLTYKSEVYSYFDEQIKNTPISSVKTFFGDKCTVYHVLQVHALSALTVRDDLQLILSARQKLTDPKFTRPVPNLFVYSWKQAMRYEFLDWMEDLRMDSIDGFTVLGGIVEIEMEEDNGHAIHFVTCQNKIAFIDSNERGMTFSLDNVWKNYSDDSYDGSVHLLLLENKRGTKRRASDSSDDHRVLKLERFSVRG